MKFVFEKSGGTVIAEMPEQAGYDYAKKHGYNVIEAVNTDPAPIPLEEMGEMFLDHEYRILLLEYGSE